MTPEIAATALWLATTVVCTEPYPPECMRPTIDQITSNPVCIAVSKSCTLYQEWVEVDAALDEKAALYVCLDRGDAVLRRERQKGYARGRTECSPVRDRP